MSEYSGSTTIVAAKEQVFSELQGEAVILNLKSEAYHGLNGVGSRIWSLIQVPRTIDEIIGLLLEEYDVEMEPCRRELIGFLRELKAAGLIEIHNGKAE
ncbi:MAG: PqqD family protein [Deltaproteobacteria bacterium HGW-Deltaproteobacteria-15]|jgi:hypothetical protein|nr:MAG: PqqD family protein [Deltaproteobacteria bacterium HGW-Deltaproteobacteria-15]